MTSAFATVTQATAFHAVGRMHYTLGVLDSAVLSRTAFLSGAVMLSIQTVYALASGASAPLISIGLNVLVIECGWLLLRASHLSMLYLDKDKELAGFAGPSGIDESNRRWFHSWADGAKGGESNCPERHCLNRESELFSKGELIVSAPNSVVTGPERTDKDNADGIMSPKSTYSFPQHSKLYEMNVIRMPMATPAALSLRLKAPRPASIRDSPVAAEAESAVGAVDSAAKEAVWCVADAGGTMVAARESDLSTDDMMMIRESVLRRRHESLPLDSENRFRLDNKIAGISSTGIEIVLEHELDQEEATILGLQVTPQYYK
ncbi:hypothetical protein HDU78_007106 [Chytriomyces hyalinus]|nr:hypothetical protein HDU78_007106 [Chytriomyces hyalinus]